VLINNAGVSGDDAQGKPLWEVPKETWDSVMNVNVHGILNVMRHIVPAMVEAGSGLVVNMSSGTGHSTFDSSGNGVYSTSKWCVESISKCVAMTLPEPVICVPFAPGVVRTEMTDADVPDATEWAVLAAPFILNLGDSPAKEGFNGTSMVRATRGQCSIHSHCPRWLTRLSEQVMPGYYQPDYVAGWSIPPNHPLP
jgi:NAD(P)-dependent dehydrogenase (short-subunit alcohol dehydrogenase family)